MFPKFLPLLLVVLGIPIAAGGCVRPPAPAEVNTAVLPTVTAVPSTEVVEEMAETPTVAPTETSTETPTETPTEAAAEVAAEAAAAVTPETAEGTVAHYQGPNSYRATPRFDVAYDTSVWEYVEDDGSGRQSQLKHRSDQGCTIWLRAGAVGTTEVATVWLAERAWTIGQVQPQVILYTAPEGDISWNFGVLLPQEYSGMGNSSCQDAAERVLDTFKIVE